MTRLVFCSPRCNILPEWPTWIILQCHIITWLLLSPTSRTRCLTWPKKRSISIGCTHTNFTVVMDTCPKSGISCDYLSYILFPFIRAGPIRHANFPAQSSRTCVRHTKAHETVSRQFGNASASLLIHRLALGEKGCNACRCPDTSATEIQDWIGFEMVSPRAFQK